MIVLDATIVVALRAFRSEAADEATAEAPFAAEPAYCEAAW